MKDDSCGDECDGSELSARLDGTDHMIEGDLKVLNLSAMYRSFDSYALYRAALNCHQFCFASCMLVSHL